MSIRKLEPLIHSPRITIPVSAIRFKLHQSIFYPSSIKLCKIVSTSSGLKFFPPRANLMQSPLLPESTASQIIFSETFSLNRIQTIEGNLSVKLKKVEKEEFEWELVVSLNLKGKWLLHWGVTYCDDDSERDQPPERIWPPGSITIKDYAIETPFNKSSASERADVSEVHINIDENDPIDTIHFVLKEVETGHGINTTVEISEFLLRIISKKITITSREIRALAYGQVAFFDKNMILRCYTLGYGRKCMIMKTSITLHLGALLQFSSFLAKQENSWSKEEASQNKQIKNSCEEYPISKEEPVENRMILSVICGISSVICCHISNQKTK